MATRSFEEIEAAHRARAIRNGLIPPDDDNPKVDEDDPRDDDPPEQNTNLDNDPPEQNNDDDDRFNKLTAELRQVRNELDAAKGRVIPEQRRSAALETSLQQLTTQYDRERDEWKREREELMRQLEEQAQKDFRPEDLLSEEERERLDPDMLTAFAKIAQAAAKRAMPKTNVEGTIRDYMQQERTKELEDYKQDQLSNPKRNVSKLETLIDSTQFTNWLDDNKDVQYTAQALKLARTKREVDDAMKVLDKRLNDFFEETKGSTRSRQTTDAKTTSLDTHMRRTKSDGANGKALSDMADRLKAAARSRHGRNSPEAKELESQFRRFR